MTSKYVLILVWIGIAAVIFSQEGMQQPENICGKTEYRYRFLWAFLVFLPVIWMVGTRGNIGDTESYAMTFRKMPQAISGLAHYMSTVKKDRGFYLLSAIIKLIIGNNTVRYNYWRWDRDYVLFMFFVNILLIMQLAFSYLWHQVIIFHGCIMEFVSLQRLYCPLLE